MKVLIIIPAYNGGEGEKQQTKGDKGSAEGPHGAGLGERAGLVCKAGAGV